MAAWIALIFSISSCFVPMTAVELLKPNGNCTNQGTICEYNWNVEHRDTMVTYENRESGLPIFRDGDSLYKRNTNSCDAKDPLSDSILTEKVITADGTYRSVIVINGQLPGPPIIVNNGTQVVVHVTNNLMMEGITIHWHGMVQRNTPWMDGVSGVSHCPINPGEKFTYRFLATPPGTHWYHSHLGTQRTDGLYGALIVLPPKENKKVKNTTDPDYEGEFRMILHDWMRDTSLDINNRILWEMQRLYPGYDNTSSCFNQTRQSDGTEIGVTPFRSGLINGKGLFYPYEKSSRRDVIDNNLIPMEIFTVKGSLLYRFRVINAAMIYAFSVSIDKHKLHVIATDGNMIDTVIVDELIINSGERFDFYIKTGKFVDNFWIRAKTLETIDINNNTVYPGHVEAILRYEGASNESLPTTTPTSCTQSSHCVALNCPFSYFPPDKNIDCISIAKVKAPASQPQPPSIPNINDSNAEEIFINFHFAGITSRRSSVNGRRFIPPSTPPMTLPRGKYEDYMTMCNETECSERHCSCTHFIEIKTDKVVQIVLYNMVKYKGEGIRGTPHPVHLHGHHFYVLKIGYAKYNASGFYTGDNEDIDCGEDERCNSGKWNDTEWGGDNIPGLNLVNPPMKDTVIVPVGGYVVIRYVTDNPGWWFVHCHIEIHQVEGMALMIKEGDESEMKKPPKNFRTCGHFTWSAEEFNETMFSESVKTQAGLTILLTAILPTMLVVSCVIIIIIKIIIMKKKRRNYTTSERTRIRYTHADFDR